MSSLFQSSKIEEAENDYSRITLAPEQRGIVEGIANIMSQYVEISQVALRGFIWNAITKWQMESTFTQR